MNTKVVLKRRVHDGREKSSDPVHTQCRQGTDLQNTVSDAYASDPWQDTESGEKKKRRSAYFWSSLDDAPDYSVVRF
jgi:hypothetical protein